MNRIDLHEKKILIVSEEELEEIARALVDRESWLQKRLEESPISKDRDRYRHYKRRLNVIVGLSDEVDRLRQGHHLIEG